MWATVQPQVALLIISHKYALINGDNAHSINLKVPLELLLIFLLLYLLLCTWLNMKMWLKPPRLSVIAPGWYLFCFLAQRGEL